MKVEGKLDFTGNPLVNTTDKLVPAHVTTLDPVVGNDNTQGYFPGYVWVATTSNTVFLCEDASTGAAVWTDITAAGGASPLTTKGDIYGFSTVDARLPVGANGLVLTADSAEATGLKWEAVFSSPLTTKGDIHGYSTTDARLPVGTNNQKLIADSAETTGLKWITDLGHVAIGIEGIVTLGAATSGYTVASVVTTNEMVYYIDGGNPSGSNTKTVYKQFSIPSDYKSGGTIYIDTTKTAAITAYTVTAYIDDVVDTTLNALDISPTGNNVFELISSAFGSAMSGGESISLQINFEGAAGEDIEIRGIYFEYNK